MEQLITIKPYDLENKKINMVTYGLPVTFNQVGVSEDVPSKLSSFDNVQKGMISSDTIRAINPDYDKVISNINVNNLFEKIGTAVALTVKSGHKELDVTKEELELFFENYNSKIIDECEKIIEHKDKIIKELANNIRMLEIKQKILEVAINEVNDEEKVRVA